MAKAVREAEGKAILAKKFQALQQQSSENGRGRPNLCLPVRTATVTAKTDYTKLAKEHPWLEKQVVLKLQTVVFP